MEIKQETNTQKITETATTTDNSIAYKGTVTVSLVKNKKIISSNTYKNTGKLPLFKFIVDCLGGKYSIAEPNRPKFVQLFSAGEAGTSSDVNIATVLASSSSIRTPQKIIYSDTPELEYISQNSIDSASVYFKFTIPYTQLSSLDNINLIALYSQDNYSDTSSPSAYFKIVNSSDNTKLGALISNPSAIDSTYSLYIQWKMTVQGLSN